MKEKLDTKNDKYVLQAMKDVLFDLIYFRKYKSKDLLMDFYNSMEGVATLTSSEFSVSVCIVKGTKNVEHGIISGNLKGFGLLSYGQLKYKGPSGTFYGHYSPTTSNINNTINSFMKGIKKGASEEIKNQAKDILKSELLGALGDVSKTFEIKNGIILYNVMATTDILSETCDTFSVLGT